MNRGVMFIALLKGEEGTGRRAQAGGDDVNGHVDPVPHQVLGCLGVSRSSACRFPAHRCGGLNILRLNTSEFCTLQMEVLMLKPNGLPPSPTSAFLRREVLAPEWEEVRYRPLLSNLAVDPRYRRRGIARRLMKVAERTAGEGMGFAELLLKVEHRNLPALELYRQLGYRETVQAKIVEDRFVPLAHLANNSTEHSASASIAGANATASCVADGPGLADSQERMSAPQVIMTSRGPQVSEPASATRPQGQTGTWEPTTNICLRKSTRL
jgi:GNAT superfamily N-acetyltransferase